MVEANFPDGQMEAPVIMAMVPSTGTFQPMRSRKKIEVMQVLVQERLQRPSSLVYFQLPLGLEVSERTENTGDSPR